MASRYSEPCITRFAIRPQSGSPDAFFEACFEQPLHSPDSPGAEKHWVYSPWFCFTPKQQSSRIAPVKGRGIDGISRVAAFGAACSFFAFVFLPSVATHTLSSRIASSPSKPYFNAHARITSALNAFIAFCCATDTLTDIISLDILTSQLITLLHLRVVLLPYFFILISIFFYITYFSPLLKISWQGTKVPRTPPTYIVLIKKAPIPTLYHHPQKKIEAKFF